MTTSAARASRAAYPTDLTEAQWAILAPLVPAPAPNGRPADYERREIVNAILYLLRAGCAWRLLPHEFPPWALVYHYFRVWRIDGTWARIAEQLRGQVRQAAGRDPEPSAAVLDSQSVAMVDQAGPRGFDGAKKVTGRKRHLVVDSMGLLLMVVVTAANMGERAGGEIVLGQAKTKLPRLKLVRADGGYGGEPFKRWVAEHCGWMLEIVEHLTPVHKFELLPWRWVVERSFGWLNRYRRLSKDYEVRVGSSEAMIEIAMINLMVGRLTQRETRRGVKRKPAKQIAEGHETT